MCEIKISSNVKFCKRILTVIKVCLLAPLPIVWFQQPDVLTSILNIPVWFKQVKQLMLAPFLPFTPQSIERLRLQDGDIYTSSVAVVLTTGMRNCSQTSFYFFSVHQQKNALRSSLLVISVESEPLLASTLFSTTARKIPFSTTLLTGLGMRA